MQFLADESCDFGVVRALRMGGHDVTAVVELGSGLTDIEVLRLACDGARVLLTEDKDFGQLAQATRHAGVVLIRFPATARSELSRAVASAVATLREDLQGAFVVLEPGRVRIIRP
jgi:predicted nuclease of predicted toxin-antitoxin system